MAVEQPRPVRDAGYYLREQPLNVPVFEGKGAAILGIHGQAVDPETFLNLHAGYTTKDGMRDQKLPKYMHPERRGGFEITFNLPKCGSLLKEVAGDSRIGDIMTEARRAAMKEVEKQVDVRAPWSKPGNLVYAAFRHGSSRANDPHAHDHVYIANLSKAGKTYKAIEFRYLDMEKVSGIYRDAMMKGFRQLGYKVKRSGPEYEVIGVPAEVKARFSSRHESIREREADYEQKKGAPLTPKAKSKLSVYDRPQKPADQPVEERRSGWLSRITHEQYDGLRGLVTKARNAVKRSRWRQESRTAYDRMRPLTIDQAPERSQNRGRGR